jgi:hypothetical protein
MEESTGQNALKELYVVTKRNIVNLLRKSFHQVTCSNHFLPRDMKFFRR